MLSGSASPSWASMPVRCKMYRKHKNPEEAVEDKCPFYSAKRLCVFFVYLGFFYIVTMSPTLLSLIAAERPKAPFRGTGPRSMEASGAGIFEISCIYIFHRCLVLCLRFYAKKKKNHFRIGSAKIPKTNVKRQRTLFSPSKMNTVRGCTLLHLSQTLSEKEGVTLLFV